MTGHSGHETGTGQQAGQVGLVKPAWPGRSGQAGLARSVWSSRPGQVGLVKPTWPGHPTWASMLMFGKRKKDEIFFGNLIAI
jgi:hypothetical protein